MKKNAGIKSKKEAAQRLIDGEVFYHNGHSLKFDNQWVNPFRTIYGLNNTKIDDEWSYFDNWETEIDWRENIGKGVLCWVWDEIEYKTCGLVIDYKKHVDYPYRTRPCGYKHAEPMTEAEVMEYVLK